MMGDKLRRLIADLANVWRALRQPPVPVPAVNPQSAIRNPKSNSSPQSKRRGITLLEVLISMFVLLIGLSGLAALLPLGKFEQLRGTKIEMSSATGRAAFREVRVRGMMNPGTWAYASGNAVFTTNAGGIVADTGATPTPTPSYALAIDPLGIGDSGTKSSGGLFPANAPAGTFFPIPRLTLGPGLSATARAALADMIFRCQDDLAFDDTVSADNLLPQVFAKDGSQNAVKRQSTGDYSWLLTVVPDMSATGGNLIDLPVRVSVAVFYKRDLQSMPGANERACELVSPTGNGETSLKITSANVAAQYGSDGVKHLDVKPGQWIMVAGCPDVTVAAANQHWQLSWQRIVAADDTVEASGAWTRAVTLAGADQQFATNADPAKAKNIAFLFDGVIAVYEKNMKLEFDSIFQ